VLSHALILPRRAHEKDCNGFLCLILASMNEKPGRPDGRWVRWLLWMTACLVVIPAWGYGIVTGRLVLALGGLPLAVLMMYFSLAKRICPACGKVVRTISTPLAHCLYCGTAYEQSRR
jgi:hypothetical protein